MAELDLSPAQKFAAAASVLALTTGRRLSRNFRSYRNNSPVLISKSSVLLLWNSIKHNCYSLHNLLENEQSFTPFYITVAGEINDNLEELHRTLLYFPAETIEDLIPVIDRQRDFWKDFINTDFYDEQLSIALEKSVQHDLNLMKDQIDTLPNSVTF